jgi:hypothetical protein
MSDDAMHVRFTRSEIVMGTHQPRPRGCDRAKVVEVVETLALVGAGVPGDPSRILVEYWTRDGQLLAERDTYVPTEADRAVVPDDLKGVPQVIVDAVDQLVAAVDQDARIDGPAYWISKRNALLACIQIAINEAEAAAVVESERCADKAMMRVITGQ